MGKWYVVIVCELPDVPIAESLKPPVGIDVGIEAFLTTSDGERAENPRYLKKELPALRRAQRAFCRKKKGGRNRRRAARAVSLLHAKVRNRRKDHHHKVAAGLVRSHGLIAAESLNVKGMLGNRRLSRAIQDAG